jgi:hypothetical protein
MKIEWKTTKRHTRTGEAILEGLWTELVWPIFSSLGSKVNSEVSYSRFDVDNVSWLRSQLDETALASGGVLPDGSRTCPFKRRVRARQVARIMSCHLTYRPLEHF